MILCHTAFLSHEVRVLQKLSRGAGNVVVRATCRWGCADTNGANCTGPSHNYNITPTLSYMKAALAQTIEAHNGDHTRVIFLGHSRGAIASQAVAYHNDEVAALWKGAALFLIKYSHRESLPTRVLRPSSLFRVAPSCFTQFMRHLIGCSSCS